MPITAQTTKIKTNVHLSNIAVQYKNSDFMWSELAPPVMVRKESDKYRKYKKDGYFSGAPDRADGAQAEEASLSYDDASYTTKEKGQKDIVTDRAINNADDVFSLKADTTKFLTEKVKIGMEIDAANKLTSTTGGISSASPDHVVTPSKLWDDQTNSTPRDDITTGIEAVSKQIGRKPNVILMPADVEMHLARHPNIDAIRKYTDKSMLTAGGLPKILWGLQVKIASAVKNTNVTGVGVSLGYIWGKNCIIAYVNSADTITLAKTFVLRSRYMRTTTWRDEEREGEFIRVISNYVVKVIVPEAGYLLNGVIT